MKTMHAARKAVGGRPRKLSGKGERWVWEMEDKAQGG
jgi:hypothetical protein